MYGSIRIHDNGQPVVMNLCLVLCSLPNIFTLFQSQDALSKWSRVSLAFLVRHCGMPQKVWSSVGVQVWAVMKSAARTRTLVGLRGSWIGLRVKAGWQPSYDLSQRRAKFNLLLLVHTRVNWLHGKFLALNSTPLTLRISAFILDTESPPTGNSAGVNVVP